MSNTIRMPARGREAAGRGLAPHHEVITDELLDHLAGRFLRTRVRELTGCAFEQYILQPRAWDRIAEALREGWAACYNPACPGIVTLIPPRGGQNAHC